MWRFLKKGQSIQRSNMCNVFMVAVSQERTIHTNKQYVQHVHCGGVSRKDNPYKETICQRVHCADFSRKDNPYKATISLICSQWRFLKKGQSVQRNNMAIGSRLVGWQRTNRPTLSVAGLHESNGSLFALCPSVTTWSGRKQRIPEENWRQQ